MIKPDQGKQEALRVDNSDGLAEISAPAVAPGERSALKGIATFAALGLSVLAITPKTEASVIKDTLSNPAAWQGVGGISAYQDGNIIPRDVVSAFRGDGGAVKEVDVLFGVGDGDGIVNAVSPLGVGFSVNFFSSKDAWLANPFPHDSSATTKVFSAPSNADWQTVVGTTPILQGDGTTGELNLYLAKFDVSDMNWVTADGGLQGIGVYPNPNGVADEGNFQTAFALSTSSVVGTDSDWYLAEINGSNFVGPGTLEGLGYGGPYAAYEVVTNTVVPEPSSVAVVATAAGLLGLRRRRG